MHLVCGTVGKLKCGSGLDLPREVVTMNPLLRIRQNVGFLAGSTPLRPTRACEKWMVVLRDPEGTDPNLSLDRYPERRSGKRSRLHLDLYTKNREAEVERLGKMGATRYPWRYKTGDDFVVLEDPDGNLFCVVQRNAW